MNKHLIVSIAEMVAIAVSLKIGITDLSYLQTNKLSFSGLTQANWETRFLVDIYVLKTMIYCLNRVSLRKSCLYFLQW